MKTKIQAEQAALQATLRAQESELKARLAADKSVEPFNKELAKFGF